MLTFLLKKSLFGFVCILVSSLLAFSVLYINILWAQIACCAGGLVLWTWIVFANYYKEGQDAVKVLYHNDETRERIAETGEDLPLKEAQEYRTWKGFVLGLIMVAPLLISMLVHLILMLALGEWAIGGGQVATYLYLDFFSIIMLTAFGGTVIGAWQYFILLYAAVIIVGVVWLSYYLGARKTKKQFAFIDAKKKQIYGDKK